MVNQCSNRNHMLKRQTSNYDATFEKKRRKLHTRRSEVEKFIPEGRKFISAGSRNQIGASIDNSNGSKDCGLHSRKLIKAWSSIVMNEDAATNGASVTRGREGIQKIDLTSPAVQERKITESSEYAEEVLSKGEEYVPLRKIEEGTSQEKRRGEKRGRKRSLGRKMLTMRVLQRNLVYVVGLTVRVAKEETLRTKQYFGKYGKLLSIAVNKKRNSAYVRFKNAEDAEFAIRKINGKYIDGARVKATYGMSKYCANFLRGTNCTNPSCFYLHHFARSEDCFSKEDLSNVDTFNYQELLELSRQLRRYCSYCRAPMTNEDYIGCRSPLACCGVCCAARSYRIFPCRGAHTRRWVVVEKLLEKTVKKLIRACSGSLTSSTPPSKAHILHWLFGVEDQSELEEAKLLDSDDYEALMADLKKSGSSQRLIDDVFRGGGRFVRL